MNIYQEALDKAKNNCDNMYQDELGNINKYSQDTDYFDTLQELVDNYSTIEKALLLACEKISFGEGNDYEPETQEEAQDNYIYKKYTRPKELMEKYIEKARKELSNEKSR